MKKIDEKKPLTGWSGWGGGGEVQIGSAKTTKERFGHQARF